MSTAVALLKQELDEHRGIARMVPLWLPRTFLPPGRRLKLHPDDLYACGVEKGGICERWFCSTGAPVPDGDGVANAEETMSLFYLGTSGKTISFPEAISQIGTLLLGAEMMETLGTFKMFAKLFDYAAPLPHHIHPKAVYANRVGMNQKPESYYFPIELNSITYNHDYTFFGLVPGTTKEQFLECIRAYGTRDNQILSLSQAYKIKLGTGWFLPAGLLHAPGSVVTYEPQYMSDALVFYQNVIEGKYVMDAGINETIIPKGFTGDRAEYLLEILDWDANFDPHFREKYYHEPIPVKPAKEMRDDGYYEEWISYGSEDFSAKRLVVAPGRSVKIRDAAAYGFIMMQGFGSINGMEICTPSLIRFGQQTADEAFVVHQAANDGVMIENRSQFSDLVMLKHFNGGNPEMPVARPHD